MADTKITMEIAESTDIYGAFLGEAAAAQSSATGAAVTIIEKLKQELEESFHKVAELKKLENRASGGELRLNELELDIAQKMLVLYQHLEKSDDQGEKEEVFNWAYRYIEQGGAAVQNFIAKCWFDGEGTDQVTIEAINLWHLAAEQGHAEAQFHLGECFYRGEAVRKEASRAVEWWGKAAMQGYVRAQSKLALCFYFGKGVAKDEAAAVGLWKMAAERGDVEAQYNLGMFLSNGKGLFYHRAEAAKWLYKAAAQRHVEATVALQDVIFLVLDKVRQGDVEAQYDLAVCAFGGYGVVKDSAVAVRLWKVAAAKGHANSQFSLGMCFYFGEGGVIKDIVEAAKWFHEAAAQRHVEAQHELKRIIACLRVKATQGDLQAHFDLVMCLQKGYGGEQYMMGVHVSHNPPQLASSSSSVGRIAGEDTSKPVSISTPPVLQSAVFPQEQFVAQMSQSSQ